MKGHVHLRDGTTVNVKFTWTGPVVTVFVYTDFGTELYLGNHAAPYRPSMDTRSQFHDSLFSVIREGLRRTNNLIRQPGSMLQELDNMTKHEIRKEIDEYFERIGNAAIRRAVEHRAAQPGPAAI
jgi:hypothetical protein